MTTNNQQQLEETISKALEFAEAGKSEAEILDIFPRYRRQLREVFDTVNNLHQFRGSFTAPRELLHRILDTLPDHVVTPSAARYNKGSEAAKGPTLHFVNGIFASLPRQIVPAGMAAVALLLITVAYVAIPRSKQVSTTVPVGQPAPSQTAKVTPQGLTAVKATLTQTKPKKVTPPKVAFRPDTTRPRPQSLADFR